MSKGPRNSALARRLAALYEDMTGRAFPGGPGNAYIRRAYPSQGWRQHGGWVWWLHTITETAAKPLPFGSVRGAKLAVKDPVMWIEIDPDDEHPDSINRRV